MEYLSLYDFLGKAAGKELGGEVAAAAYRADIKHQTREIANPKYQGTVHLYPKDFLDFHFRKPEFEDTLSGRQDFDDDLPF